MSTSTALSSNQQERANYYKLVVEIAWFGLAVASTSRFLSVYAIRLGASSNDLGWMTSLPFVMLLVSTTFSSWWRSRYTSSIKAIYWPSLGFRLVFLLPALTPLLPAHLQPMWLIFSVALPALPQGISSTIFVGMMREAIPEEKQVKLASARNLWMNITIALAALGFGVWLEHAPFPMNYQVMFLAAFVLAMISQWHVMKIHLKSEEVPAPLVKSNAQPLRSPVFQRAILTGVIIHIGFMAVIPVTPMRLVNDLNANEGFMAIYGIAELASAALICVFIGRIANYLGNRKMIAFAMFGTAASAFILASAQQLPVTLLAAALSGASWTAAAIGLYGLFVESTHNLPINDMTRYTTVYNQIIYFAAFIGPMIGSNLANTGLSLITVILIGGFMRSLAGLSVLHLESLFAVPAQKLRRSYRRS
ncbi:MAG: MFS transporter [Anaerolineae bacterium]|nr:MFS transporter [Anaerolineae bacterium]